MDKAASREARRRALRQLQLGLSTRAAGADDGGSASDAMRAYTDSIGDDVFGVRDDEPAAYGKRSSKGRK